MGSSRLYSKWISTHAPAGGATVIENGFTLENTLFLLTPLREGRQLLMAEYLTNTTISTHAPAGGATLTAASPATIPLISTHAPAGGATDLRVRMMPTIRVFLLTPLREGRRPWGRRGSTQNGFLLTPLREGRL